jgi:hypothetical protein
VSAVPPPDHPELVQFLRFGVATRDQILSMTGRDLGWTISEIHADIAIAEAVEQVQGRGSE